MKCTIDQTAAVKLNEMLAEENDKNLKFRVFVAHAHGDHAHYGLGLDYMKETDELVVTDSGIEVLLLRGEKFLDGVEIAYDAETDEWSVHHPNAGHHHHHE